jgi:hypothetical protein
MDSPTDDGAPRRWLIDPSNPPPGVLDRAISEHYLADEPSHVRFLSGPSCPRRSGSTPPRARSSKRFAAGSEKPAVSMRS